MTINQLIIAEFQARKRGDKTEADRLQQQRWEQAMGSVICSGNNSKQA